MKTMNRRDMLNGKSMNNLFKKSLLLVSAFLVLSTHAFAGQPKYVFMFIGDGLSHTQAQITNYYLDSLKQDTDASLAKKKTLKSQKQLSFMNFDATGITTTYDSTSFAPDSASTATSLATGKKTHSGTINMNENFTVSYETITEKVKKQLGYKVGIVSSVTLNHATPAAYYAHNKSRNHYYEIGLELVQSNFDYFAGGEIAQHNNDGKQSIYEIAQENGYKVVLKNQAMASKVSNKDGKVIIIGEDAKGALPYETDRKKNSWALADFVKKGIEVLDNDKGFFMMVESGKIDWAGHQNDAHSVIYDTIAFDNAIKVALDFYKKHPEDTLIVVTGDHETGGLTIGFAGTEYDTFLYQLKQQQGSYDVFAERVKKHKENKASFETVFADVKNFFGLSLPHDKKVSNKRLVLHDYELEKIKEAYEISINNKDIDKRESLLKYGNYNALAITVMQILNNKSGVDFTSFAHTGSSVGTYAHGVGAENFAGFYDNTDIYHALAKLLQVK